MDRLTYDVVGLGYTGIDQLCLVPSFPSRGTKVAMAGFCRQGGGQTGTALTALSRWGLSTAAICAVGDDEPGRAAVAELAADGVDTSRMVIRPGVATQTAFIVVERRGGERTIVYDRDAALNLQPDDVDLSPLDSARCLFIDGHEPASLTAARAARDRGLTVVLDCERIRDFTAELLPLCDVVLCNSGFPGEFTGIDDLRRSLERLARFGMAVVGMTLGDRGAMALVDGQLVRRPAFDVEVVDTTGAGDVFHAGFTYAHLAGRSVADCLDFAGAAAALKCRQLGGRAGIPASPEPVWALVEHGERLE